MRVRIRMPINPITSIPNITHTKKREKQQLNKKIQLSFLQISQPKKNKRVAEIWYREHEIVIRRQTERKKNTKKCQRNMQ